MSKLLQIVLIIIAVASIAVADVLLKKISVSTTNLGSALKNWLMIPVVVLYLIQIVLFMYVFVKKAELGVVGIIQTALYAVIVLGAAVLLFHEQISITQIIGMVLAIIGVILINI